MRKSRVLLAGVAVAAAGVATSAFTASNDVSAGDAVLGYGEATVSGATISAVEYNRAVADNSLLSSVVFHSSTDVSGETATMTLKDSAGPTVIGNYTCVVAARAAGSNTITCATSAAVDSFDTVGLTVGGA